MVVGVGDVEQRGVAPAGRVMQIGDVVGDGVEQLGDGHGIMVAPLRVNFAGVAPLPIV